MKSEKEIENKIVRLNDFIESNRRERKSKSITIDEIEELDEALLRLKMRKSELLWVLIG
jgi:hypothetical protein